MDPDKITRTADNVGCLKDWIGSFEQWMRDEESRCKITESDRLEILELNRQWQANRGPLINGNIKHQLTEWLQKIVTK